MTDIKSIVNAILWLEIIRYKLSLNHKKLDLFQISYKCPGAQECKYISTYKQVHGLGMGQRDSEFWTVPNPVALG